jgi:enoyl-CoA hydratase
MPFELEKVGAIGVLRLRRAERANALNRQLLEALAERQESLRTNTEIRVLVTVGEGKGFSAGSDLEELAGLSIEEAVDSQKLEGRVCRNFLSLPQPTIAAVHGYALGGGLFLAAYHDFRIIASDARLGAPEVVLGWNPTFGMTRLRSLAGIAATTRWLMSGEEFTPAEAEREGFATQLAASAEDVLSQALELGEQLAALPGSGLAAVKEAFWRDQAAELERADTLEAELFGRCLASPQARSSLLRYKKAYHTMGKTDE